MKLRSRDAYFEGDRPGFVSESMDELISFQSPLASDFGTGQTRSPIYLSPGVCIVSTGTFSRLQSD